MKIIGRIRKFTFKNIPFVGHLVRKWLCVFRLFRDYRSSDLLVFDAIRRSNLPLDALEKLVLDPDSLVQRRNFFDEWSCDLPDDPCLHATPWVPYCFIDFLKDRLSGAQHVFEFGAGRSSFFFSRYVASVDSVENDSGWYERMEAKVPGNVNLYLEEERDDYIHKVERLDRFYDLVFVDGRFRYECAKSALAKLTEKGVLVLDDSSREKYQPVFDLYEQKGFRVLSFSGLKSQGGGDDQTTIFYRPGNCLGI